MEKVKNLVNRALRRLVRLLNKLLPDRFLLLLKANLRLVKKMDYSRHDIYLNIDTEVENDVRLHSCAKEPETVEWIETFLKEGGVMYDIGANVGAYALVASKFTHGKAKIYAFEPSFSTFANLSRNVFLNGCSGSIIPLHLALSDKTGLDNLNYLDLVSGSSCHAFGANVMFTGETFEPVFKQPIIAYTIDDLIEAFGIEVPNLIKIDVDGIELAILKGAEKTLCQKEVRTVLVEVNENLEETANAIVALLTGAGFKLRSKHRFEYGGPESDLDPFSRSYNYIFVRAQVNG